MSELELPQEVLDTSADLDHKKKFQELWNYLHEQEKQFPNNFELMWRISCVSFDMSLEKPGKKKEYVTEAFSYAQKLLEMRPDHFLSHKWYAISLSGMLDFRSTKEKIVEAVQVKEHLVKAIQLYDKDQTLHHSLGRWCFEVASVSKIERVLAAAIFATPPDSTYEEALKHFLNAEAAGEGKEEFLENLLWTGHAYSKVGNSAKATEYYTRATKVEPKSFSDREIIKEAKQKLSSWW
jgi:tetratricopeptide (TPR) repeat protein